ncbi:MAG: hypothetical protein ACRDLA_02540 [Thermoleophilaceae bacterium]
MKGLASGFENVVTVDLILSMRKAAEGEEREVGEAPDGALAIAVDDVSPRTLPPHRATSTSASSVTTSPAIGT